MPCAAKNLEHSEDSPVPFRKMPKTIPKYLQKDKHGKHTHKASPQVTGSQTKSECLESIRCRKSKSEKNKSKKKKKKKPSEKDTKIKKRPRKKSASLRRKLLIALISKSEREEEKAPSKDTKQVPNEIFSTDSSINGNFFPEHFSPQLPPSTPRNNSMGHPGSNMYRGRNEWPSYHWNYHPYKDNGGVNRRRRSHLDDVYLPNYEDDNLDDTDSYRRRFQTRPSWFRNSAPWRHEYRHKTYPKRPQLTFNQVKCGPSTSSSEKNVKEPDSLKKEHTPSSSAQKCDRVESEDKTEVPKTENKAEEQNLESNLKTDDVSEKNSSQVSENEPAASTKGEEENATADTTKGDEPSVISTPKEMDSDEESVSLDFDDFITVDKIDTRRSFLRRTPVLLDDYEVVDMDISPVKGKDGGGDEAKENKLEDACFKINSGTLLDQINAVLREHKRALEMSRAEVNNRVRSKSLSVSDTAKERSVVRSLSVDSIDKSTHEVSYNFDPKTNLLLLLKDQKSNEANRDFTNILKVLEEAKTERLSAENQAAPPVDDANAKQVVNEREFEAPFTNKPADGGQSDHSLNDPIKQNIEVPHSTIFECDERKDSEYIQSRVEDEKLEEENRCGDNLKRKGPVISELEPKKRCLCAEEGNGQLVKSPETVDVGIIRIPENAKQKTKLPDEMSITETDTDTAVLKRLESEKVKAILCGGKGGSGSKAEDSARTFSDIERELSSLLGMDSSSNSPANCRETTEEDHMHKQQVIDPAETLDGVPPEENATNGSESQESAAESLKIKDFEDQKKKEECDKGGSKGNGISRGKVAETSRKHSQNVVTGSSSGKNTTNSGKSDREQSRVQRKTEDETKSPKPSDEVKCFQKNDPKISEKIKYTENTKHLDKGEERKRKIEKQPRRQSVTETQEYRERFKRIKSLFGSDSESEMDEERLDSLRTNSSSSSRQNEKNVSQPSKEPVKPPSVNSGSNSDKKRDPSRSENGVIYPLKKGPLKPVERRRYSVSVVDEGSKAKHIEKRRDTMPASLPSGSVEKQNFLKDKPTKSPTTTSVHDNDRKVMSICIVDKTLKDPRKEHYRYKDSKKKALKSTHCEQEIVKKCKTISQKSNMEKNSINRRENDVPRTECPPSETSTMKNKDSDQQHMKSLPAQSNVPIPKTSQHGLVTAKSKEQQIQAELQSKTKTATESNEEIKYLQCSTLVTDRFPVQERATHHVQENDCTDRAIALESADVSDSIDTVKQVVLTKQEDEVTEVKPEILTIDLTDDSVESKAEESKKIQVENGNDSVQWKAEESKKIKVEDVNHFNSLMTEESKKIKVEDVKPCFVNQTEEMITLYRSEETVSSALDVQATYESISLKQLRENMHVVKKLPLDDLQKKANAENDNKANESGDSCASHEKNCAVQTDSMSGSMSPLRHISPQNVTLTNMVRRENQTNFSVPTELTLGTTSPQQISGSQALPILVQQLNQTNYNIQTCSMQSPTNLQQTVLTSLAQSDIQRNCNIQTNPALSSTTPPRNLNQQTLPFPVQQVNEKNSMQSPTNVRHGIKAQETLTNLLRKDNQQNYIVQGQKNPQQSVSPQNVTARNSTRQHTQRNSPLQATPPQGSVNPQNTVQQNASSWQDSAVSTPAHHARQSNARLNPSSYSFNHSIISRMLQSPLREVPCQTIPTQNVQTQPSTSKETPARNNFKVHNPMRLADNDCPAPMQEISTGQLKKACIILVNYLYFFHGMKKAQWVYIRELDKMRPQMSWVVKSEMGQFENYSNERYSRLFREMARDLTSLKFHSRPLNLAHLLVEQVFNELRKKMKDLTISWFYLMLETMMQPHKDEYMSVHFLRSLYGFVVLVGSNLRSAQNAHKQAEDPFAPYQRQLLEWQIKQYNSFCLYQKRAATQREQYNLLKSYLGNSGTVQQNNAHQNVSVAENVGSVVHSENNSTPQSVNNVSAVNNPTNTNLNVRQKVVVTSAETSRPNEVDISNPMNHQMNANNTTNQIAHPDASNRVYNIHAHDTEPRNVPPAISDPSEQATLANRSNTPAAASTAPSSVEQATQEVIQPMCHMATPDEFESPSVTQTPEGAWDTAPVKVKVEKEMPLLTDQEIETIDLTWINDIDPKQLQVEIQYVAVKKEEPMDEDDEDIVLNEDMFAVAPSPADSGISSPPIQVEYDETLFSDRSCICGKTAEYVCKCMMAMYCSGACQIEDWSSHRETCNKHTKSHQGR